jgi:hypothetical protein
MKIIKNTHNQLVIAQKMTPYSPLKIILITGSTILSLGLLLGTLFFLGVGVEKLTCQRNTETQQVSCELNQSRWMGLKQEAAIIDNVKSVKWLITEEDGDSETPDIYYNLILHTLFDQYYLVSLNALSYIWCCLFINNITFMLMWLMIDYLKEGNSQQRIFTFDKDAKLLTLEEITDKKINKTKHISFNKISLLVIENVPDNCKDGWYDGLINYTIYLGLKSDYYSFKKTQLRKKQKKQNRRTRLPLPKSLIDGFYFLIGLLLMILQLTFIILATICFSIWIFILIVSSLFDYLFSISSNKNTEELIEIELFSDRYSEVEKLSQIIASFLEIEAHLIKANC